MGINNYGYSAYKQAVDHGYKRLNNKNSEANKQRSEITDVKSSNRNKVTESEDITELNLKTLPPPEDGQIMDYKV